MPTCSEAEGWSSRGRPTAVSSRRWLAWTTCWSHPASRSSTWPSAPARAATTAWCLPNSPSHQALAWGAPPSSLHALQDTVGRRMAADLAELRVIGGWLTMAEGDKAAGPLRHPVTGGFKGVELALRGRMDSGGGPAPETAPPAAAAADASGPFVHRLARPLLTGRTAWQAATAPPAMSLEGNHRAVF